MGMMGKLKATQQRIEETKKRLDTVLIDEQSAVLIENGIYKGYAFYDLNYQVQKIEILKNIIIPMQNNRDARNIIQSQIRKNKLLKIVKF